MAFLRFENQKFPGGAWPQTPLGLSRLWRSSSLTNIRKILDLPLPLLLRLSNDVEENPGPININEIVDCTHTVHADFHQGNELMFGSNAGKQCVAMSLCSIVYNKIKSVNIWDSSIMNKILNYGNILHSAGADPASLLDRGSFQYLAFPAPSPPENVLKFGPRKCYFLRFEPRIL